LGHVTGQSGIRKSPEFVQKIIDYPEPTTATEWRQFLGMINFARKFIDKCALIAKPLTDLTGGPKNRLLTWTLEMNESYEILKRSLVE
jgi:hypothetical protein